MLGVDEGYELRTRGLAWCSMPSPDSTADSDATLEIMYKAKYSRSGSGMRFPVECSATILTFAVGESAASINGFSLGMRSTSSSWSMRYPSHAFSFALIKPMLE